MLIVRPCLPQERKEEGSKGEAAGDGTGDSGVPVEAQDLTVFVQSVMEQMVRGNGRDEKEGGVSHARMDACSGVGVLRTTIDYRYLFFVLYHTGLQVLVFCTLSSLLVWLFSPSAVLS